MDYSILKTITSTDKSTVALVAADGYDVPVIAKRLYKANEEIYVLLKNHPNPHIPKIYDLKSDSEGLLVVEEYISGETLAEYIVGHSPSDECKLALMEQLCEALKFIHSFNPPIVHRDIKPSNIIVTDDGILKLIDFDAARIYKETKRDSDTILLGTQEYAAPEQFGYSQTDVRSDIYSMGVVFSEIGIGRTNARLASGWKKIVASCTHFDPVDRYDRVGDVSSDITKLKRNVRYGFARRFIAAASALLLIAVCVVVVLRGRSDIPAQNEGEGNTITASTEDISDDDTVPTGDIPDEITPAPTESVPDKITPAPTESVPDEITPAPTESVPDEITPAPTEDIPDTDTPARIFSDTLCEVIYDRDINRRVLHGASNIREFGYDMNLLSEFSDEEMAGFDRIMADEFNNYCWQYYPSSGYDFSLNYTAFREDTTSLSVIGLQITPLTSGVQSDYIRDAEVFGAPVDAYYFSENTAYVCRDYLATLEPSLYLISFQITDAGGDLSVCEAAVLIHDCSFVPVWEDVLFPNTPTFWTDTAEYACWELPFNCSAVITDVYNVDNFKVDESLYSIASDGRSIRFGKDLFTDGRHEERFCFYVYLSDGTSQLVRIRLA